MYIASSTADSPCNKEKKKDPPEHSYLKQLQLSMKPVYENGISRDTHKKNNFQRNPTIPCIQKDQIFMKKKEEAPFLSLFPKRLLLFSPLSLEKASKNVTFFILLLLDQVQWIKEKEKNNNN